MPSCVRKQHKQDWSTTSLKYWNEKPRFLNLANMYFKGKQKHFGNKNAERIYHLQTSLQEMLKDFFRQKKKLILGENLDRHQGMKRLALVNNSDGKDSAYNPGDLGLIPESGSRERMVTHSSILAWRSPWAEEPGGLQSMGSQRVRHDWETNNTIQYNTIQHW